MSLFKHPRFVHFLRVARALHVRLLSMHVTSALSQSAGAAKYLLPASDTSCIVTHRMFVAMLLLFDVSGGLLTQAILHTACVLQ